MTTADSAEISREGPPAPLTRHFSWMMLAVLAAFMINNVLTVRFGFPGVSSALGDGGALSWVQVAVYLACIGLAAFYVVSTPTMALRWDARRISDFNA